MTDAGHGRSERLTNLPSRLVSQVAMHTDRLVNEALAAVDARKWHYAVLVTLRDLGPSSQAALSRQTGIYRSDMVALITELRWPATSSNAHPIRRTSAATSSRSRRRDMPGRASSTRSSIASRRRSSFP